MVALGALAATLGGALPAQAQDRPTAVLLRTHAAGESEAGTARGFDRVLRQRLEAAAVVSIEGSVELDLEAVQLAVGCIGESEACLRSVASETGADVLVFSSLEVAGDSRIVSVMRFDSRDGSLRRAVRTVTGEAAVLEAADPLVREIWDLPAPVVGAADGAGGGGEAEGGDEVDDDDGDARAAEGPPGLSPLPFLLVGVGAIALGGGGITLGLGFADHDAYAQAMPSTPADVDADLATLDSAQTELLAGTIMMVAGGALATAGIGWALGAGREDGSSPLAVIPLLSPNGAGVVVAGSLPGGSL